MCVTTHLRFNGIFVITLLNIYCWICWWTNFDNGQHLAKVWAREGCFILSRLAVSWVVLTVKSIACKLQCGNSNDDEEGCWCVVGKHTVYRMYAQTAEDMDDWMQAIRQWHVFILICFIILLKVIWHTLDLSGRSSCL